MCCARVPHFSVNRISVVLLACLLHVCLAGRVLAQDTEDPGASARFRLGPVRFTPTLTFAGPGVDTNVFNEFDQPKQDWTARANPKADWYLRMGRGQLTLSTGVEYQYFAKYDNQRSLNTDNNAKLSFLLGRFTPFVSGSYMNARMRPSYEIDIRARQIGDGASLGSEVRVLNRTTLMLSASRSFVRFDRNDTFLGTSLSDALNRQTDLGRAEVRQRLSSLTTFVVRADATKDRFVVSHFRDSDSTAVMPGLQFKPSALIKGEAFVGYRSFRPLDPAVPRYKGLVASLDLAWVHSGTRLALRLGRDISYSFDSTQPYYLLTDTSVRITQMIGTTWDADGLVGWQRLAYQQNAASAEAPNDSGFHAGGSVGRWFGRNLRLGFEVNEFQRHAGLAGLQDYHSVQAGFSVKYGLKP